MYAPDNRVSAYVKQELTELRREINESTITVGDSQLLSQQWNRDGGLGVVWGGQGGTGAPGSPGRVHVQGSLFQFLHIVV